ncbi:hypothetical protein B4144_2384 [Bacillus atrophaeus]|nr:hypothetical protein B4144_2384 [Bacillus atrophaeus]
MNDSSHKWINTISEEDLLNNVNEKNGRLGRTYSAGRFL